MDTQITQEMLDDDAIEQKRAQRRAMARLVDAEIDRMHSLGRRARVYAYLIQRARRARALADVVYQAALTETLDTRR